MIRKDHAHVEVECCYLLSSKKAITKIRNKCTSLGGPVLFIVLYALFIVLYVSDTKLSPRSPSLAPLFLDHTSCCLACEEFRSADTELPLDFIRYHTICRNAPH